MSITSAELDRLEALQFKMSNPELSNDERKAAVDAYSDGLFTAGQQLLHAARAGIEGRYCEVCGEVENPKRVYGDIDVCRLCFETKVYGVEHFKAESSELRVALASLVQAEQLAGVMAVSGNEQQVTEASNFLRGAIKHAVEFLERTKTKER